MKLFRASEICLLCLLGGLPALVFGDDETPPESPAEQDVEELVDTDADGSLDDAQSSIDDAIERRGLTLSGDLRGIYDYADIDNRDGSNDTDDVLLVRWRAEGRWGITPQLRLVGRIAGLCSTDECEPNFELDSRIPTSNGMADGDITIDELFLHLYRSERFDVAVGRMQTKFVARGGVYAKSLDRNDSHNVRVNWTDGAHGTLRGPSGWVGHLILQHNSARGPTNIRRGPLDFEDDDSRVSGFVAIENVTPKGILVQRGLDISYLPKSLLKDGESDCSGVYAI